jgi:PAS domain S-box-containing protein/putative nucleotidyltransferase with HDIG domain
MEETTTPALQKDYFVRLARHTQDLIYRYEFTPRRGFVYVSPSATVMTGYTPAEHYADPDLGFKLVHPDDRHLLEQISFDGDILHAPIVLRWIRKDGTMLWTEQRNVPIYDERQNVIAIEGIARDVTSRKQIEENLRLESAALEFAANAVIITDRDGTIQWVNSAFAELTGYSAEESLGRNPRDLVRSGVQDKAFYEKMWRTILSGQVWRGELINRRKDGTHYIEEQAVAPVTNPDGAITHFVGIKQDVSERKRAEEELRRKNDELLTAYDTVIEGWSCAMDLRDKETKDHTMRVTALTLNLARHMKVPENELVQIKRGALLHDIGKLGVPDNILLKPGKLTDEEWRVMRQHPALAQQMLASIEFLKPALDIPYCHHEKWDGSGYPCGLKGEEIPFAARIFAVADVWDALTSDRPYRAAWTKSQALEFIGQESGKHFDPDIAQVFLASVEALIL